MCSAFSGLPCFVTFTEAKGIAANDDEGYLPENYYNKTETEQLIRLRKESLLEIGLRNSTVGFAVNRFWRETIDYADGNVVVAYVRGRVLSVSRIDTFTATPDDINTLVRELGKLHREPNSELPPE